MERGVLSSFPAFPPELFETVLESAPEGAKIRLLLLDGSPLTCGRIVRREELGLVVEGPDGTLTAVPWHAILRVEAIPADAGKSLGFRTT